MRLSYSELENIISHWGDVGKSGSLQELYEVVVAKDPHFENLSRSAVKNEISKLLLLSIARAVPQHIVVRFVLNVPFVEVWKMLDGFLERVGNGEDQPSAGLEKRVNAGEGKLYRRIDMLEDIAARDEIGRADQMLRW